MSNSYIGPPERYRAAGDRMAQEATSPPRRRKLRIALAVAAAAILGLLAAAYALGGSSPATDMSPSPAAATITRVMKVHGVTITGLKVYTPATDPNSLMGRQGEYTSKVSWNAPDNDSADGEGIEVFATVADAQSRLSYLQAFRPPFGDGYDDLAGTAILRLSASRTPSQAHQIERVFEAAAR